MGGGSGLGYTVRARHFFRDVGKILSIFDPPPASVGKFTT